MSQTPESGFRPPAPPTQGRKVGFGARDHFTGTLVFGEGDGQVMEVGSHTEFQVALVMLARPEVVQLENLVPFPWIDKAGTPRNHYFDFRASLRDGSRTALMVKHDRKLACPRFRDAAAQIAAQVTPAFADRVCLIGPRHLDPVELHNAELILAVRRPDPEADTAAQRLLDTVAGTGTVRIGDLVDRLGLGGRGFRAVVRLIRRGLAELAAHERISHAAGIRRRAAAC
jgi:hypothetical protein